MFLLSGEIAKSESIPSDNASSTAIKEIKASTLTPEQTNPGEDQYNVTFVDTPGYGASVDSLQIIKPVIEYHHSQFQKTNQFFNREVHPQTLIRFLKAGTGAHTHVDVCLYGILHRITLVDVEYMRRLSLLCNVVPVILKCDTLRADEVFKLKQNILTELLNSKIPIYGFGLSVSELLELAKNKVSGAAPFAF
jgi:septin family protein